MTDMLQSEQHLEFPSLKEGCTPGFTGSSEPTLAKMPHCWKSHVVAQMNPSIWFDTMSLGWFIEHIKGLQLRISKLHSTLVSEEWSMPSKQCRSRLNAPSFGISSGSLPFGKVAI